MSAVLLQEKMIRYRRYCLVPDCKTREELGTKWKEKYFVFPHRDQNVAKMWVKVLGLKMIPSKSCRPLICSKHFSQDCFIQEFRERLINNKFDYKEIRKLKPGSIPTLHLPESGACAVREVEVEEESSKESFAFVTVEEEAVKQEPEDGSLQVEDPLSVSQFVTQ